MRLDGLSKYLIGSLATSTLAVSSCGVDTTALNGLSARRPCYYMTQEDQNNSVGLFRDLEGANISRQDWMVWNGHPCDSFPDLEREVPREDCVRCFDYLSNQAGWE